MSDPIRHLMQVANKWAAEPPEERSDSLEIELRRVLGPWTMPPSPDLLKFINDTPLVQSLLYDINLLPEVIDDARRWNYMVSVCEHMQAALRHSTTPAVDAGKTGESAASSVYEVLRELYEAVSAPFPPGKQGAAAQNDWSERKAAALESARSLIECGVSAASSAMGDDGWKPIETAPKDGTEILLYAPARQYEGKPVPERLTFGHWLHEEPYIREHRDLEGRYIDQDESNGYDGWLSWDGGFTEENPPTHWKSVTPPAAASPSPSNEREDKR